MSARSDRLLLEDILKQSAAKSLRLSFTPVFAPNRESQKIVITRNKDGIKSRSDCRDEQIDIG